MSTVKHPVWNIVLIALVVTLLHASVDAAGWGSLKGRFVVDGTPPEMAALDASKEAYCVQHRPMDQSVIVGDDGGLANVVVYIKLGRRDKIDVYPDYDAELDEPVVLDNHFCEFHPHITLARAGQTLIVKNSDPVGHNTNLQLRANGKANPTIAPETQFEKKLTRGESLPLPVDCNIHPFMHGQILVQDHPYMATSAEDGTFEIKNIPAGKHEFQFWHEVPGYLKSIKYKGGSLNRQGRAKLTIADGQTLDLGDIHVPASLLQ